MVNEDAALLNRRVTHMTPAALFSRRLHDEEVAQFSSIPAPNAFKRELLDWLSLCRGFVFHNISPSTSCGRRAIGNPFAWTRKVKPPIIWVRVRPLASQRARPHSHRHSIDAAAKRKDFMLPQLSTGTRGARQSSMSESRSANTSFAASR